MATALLVALLALGGCGSDEEGGRSPATAQQAAATNAPSSPLIGTWRRINSCKAFVRDLEEAGLDDLVQKALVDAGYFQRPSNIDGARPCKGATEVEHSHFFTEDGKFGSYDENGKQVDDGDFAVAGDTSVEFPSHEDEFGSAITVRYRVRGDKLDFTVVVPDSCTATCRTATQWAISAFYATPFQRVGAPTKAAVQNQAPPSSTGGGGEE